VHNVDWPLAITLAVVFIVISVVRWRYFRSLVRRRAARKEGAERAESVEPPR
jgi:hypothetical protein